MRGCEKCSVCLNLSTSTKVPFTVAKYFENYNAILKGPFLNFVVADVIHYVDYCTFQVNWILQHSFTIYTSILQTFLTDKLTQILFILIERNLFSNDNRTAGYVLSVSLSLSDLHQDEEHSNFSVVM